MASVIPGKISKKDKVIFWIFTIIVVLIESGGSLFLMNNPQVKEGYRHLGFPDYFRVELGIGMILGGIILLVPGLPSRLREWTYAGFGISCISAIIATFAVGDPPSNALFAFITLLFFIISYIYYHKTQKPLP